MVKTAVLTALIMGVIGLGLGFAISYPVGCIFLSYFALNLAYTLLLKKWIFIDVIIIAIGFLLRVLAGTAGIGITPSYWLFICTLVLALFLGLSKRQSEGSKGYPPHLLKYLIKFTAISSILSYLFYAVHQDTLLYHGTPRLIFTLPFVIYAVFRYLYLLRSKQYPHFGLDMARDVWRDKQLLLVIIGWLISVIAVLSLNLLQ